VTGGTHVEVFWGGANFIADIWLSPFANQIVLCANCCSSDIGSGNRGGSGGCILTMKLFLRRHGEERGGVLVVGGVGGR